MSRHVLSAPVGEALVGWDSAIDGFFLQYFESSAASDDPPTIWLPRLDLAELERQPLPLGIDDAR